VRKDTKCAQKKIIRELSFEQWSTGIGFMAY